MVGRDWQWGMREEEKSRERRRPRGEPRDQETERSKWLRLYRHQRLGKGSPDHGLERLRLVGRICQPV